MIFFNSLYKSRYKKSNFYDTLFLLFSFFKDHDYEKIISAKVLCLINQILAD